MCQMLIYSVRESQTRQKVLFSQQVREAFWLVTSSNVTIDMHAGSLAVVEWALVRIHVP